MTQLLFFGRFSDLIENGVVTLPNTVTNTDELIVWLGETHDGFTDLWKKPGTTIVVNNEMVSRTQPINPTDEIAILSALSGG